MGHMNFDILVKISTKQEVRDVQKIIKPLRNIFRQCQHGKQSRVNFKTKEYETSNPLEVVHTIFVDQQGLKSCREKGTSC